MEGGDAFPWERIETQTHVSTQRCFLSASSQIPGHWTFFFFFADEPLAGTGSASFRRREAAGRGEGGEGVGGGRASLHQAVSES